MMDQAPATMIALIDRVRVARKIDVKAIEDMTGAPLSRTGDSNDAFTFYTAANVTVAEQRFDVDLRLPAMGGSATGGPLLVLNVKGKCIGRAYLKFRYGPLTLTQVPHGDAVVGESHWSREEPWGRLSFGFPTRTPDCLGSVVFKLSRRNGRAP